MQTSESEDNATPMALLSHHSSHDSVGIACQHCPINNETAMRFLGYMPFVLQPLDFYSSWIESLYAWLMERTHGPCVPTCIRTAHSIHHFTHQYGQCGYIETQGSYVHSARNNQLVYLFTRSLPTETWADARAVRPYMHSNSLPYPSFYTSIWTMWLCRDARLVRPFGAKQSTC